MKKELEMTEGERNCITKVTVPTSTGDGEETISVKELIYKYAIVCENFRIINDDYQRVCDDNKALRDDNKALRAGVTDEHNALKREIWHWQHVNTELVKKNRELRLVNGLLIKECLKNDGDCEEDD